MPKKETPMRLSKLEGRIKEKFRTYENFAFALGATIAPVSRRITQQVEITLKDIEQWCDLLDIGSNEIAEYFLPHWKAKADKKRKDTTNISVYP